MKNTAIEKLSYTEVTKNISQAEYNQTQEEYILSKSPDRYDQSSGQGINV